MDEIEEVPEKSIPSVNWMKKESIEDVRHRLLVSKKWLCKAVLLMKSLKPEQIDLSVWANADESIMEPASWCGKDPEFQADGLIYRVPGAYQREQEKLPVYMPGKVEFTGCAAISEFFELYAVTNGAVLWYDVFGYAGESCYDEFIGGEEISDQQRFIERVGLHLQQIADDFEARFGEPLLIPE